MSSLPEILRGAIVEDYGEIMQAAGPGGPGPQPGYTGPPKCDTNPPVCDTSPPFCFGTPGPTCGHPKCPKADTAGCPPEKAAFQPTLAGWSTPPALDIR